MYSLVIIVVGAKYKVYKDVPNNRRKLVGTFGNETDAVNFINNYK
jgi:hypothetical protein